MKDAQGTSQLNCAQPTPKILVEVLTLDVTISGDEAFWE